MLKNNLSGARGLWLSLSLCILLIPQLSLAVDSKVFNAGGVGASIEEKTGLGNQTAVSTAGKIINISLVFLATIGVVLCVYAGYLWMTAAGNDEQIEKAKNILKAAVIGLIVILLSWLITTIVVVRLINATDSDINYLPLAINEFTNRA